jgi:MHS family proline/betaine transporter-like MFS transporter
MIKKIIFSSAIGNTLEYYDFALYGFLSPVISSILFPAVSPSASLLLTLGIYATGFIMRPLGGIIFGHIGDKYGRKKALTFTIFLMSIATGSIGLLPSHEHIGILTPILITILRMVQGLCMGGEYNGAVIFAMEHACNKDKSLWGGILASSTLLGCLAGTLVAAACSLSILPPASWRLAFLIGSFTGFVGLYIRKNLPDTLEYTELFQRKAILKYPIKETFKNHPYEIFTVASIMGLSGVMSGFNTIYVHILLTQRFDWEVSYSLMVVAFGLIFYIIISALSGKLSHHFRASTILISSAIAYVMAALPCMILLENGNFQRILIAQAITSIISSLFWGASNIYVYNLFPTNKRFSGIALGDSIGRSILASPMPMICLYIERLFNILAVSYYLIITTCLFLGAIISFRIYRPTIAGELNMGVRVSRPVSHLSRRRVEGTTFSGSNPHTT